MDPHALALLYQTRVVTQVYEGLVNRGKDYKLEPSLATSWEMVNATDLALQAAPGREVPRRRTVHGRRRGVLDRACAGQGLAAQEPDARHHRREEGRRGDASTSAPPAPDAVLPEKLWLVAMMSKPWCEKHNVRQAAGLQRQAGDLRGAQRQRHRPVRARALRGRRAHATEGQPGLVGQGQRGSAAATSTRCCTR